MGTPGLLPTSWQLPEASVALLLRAIHQGVHDVEPWCEFVTLLRDMLSANVASLSFRIDEEMGPGVLAVSPKPSPPFDHPYLNRGTIGPPPGGKGLLPNKLHRLSDFLDRSIPDHANFAGKIVDRFGLQHMMLVRIPLLGRGSAWLAVGRADRDFDAGEDELVTQLLPHLEIALQTYLVLERERGRSAVIGEAVRRLDVCWFKLNAECEIIDLAPGAEDLLRQAQGLRRTSDGRLALSLPAANLALAEAVKALSGSPVARARALHAWDEPWLDILVVPVRDGSCIDRMEPGVVVYVHGNSLFDHGKADQLIDLFGLTATEASLAVALCRGQTIRAAAATIGITEMTAREYLKRVFAKTGTRRQVDLVRLLLSGVTALA